MAEFEFNPDIDKITERELVPNIYERVTIGEDLKHFDDDSKTFFKRETHLNIIDSKIIASFPTSLSDNIENIHIGSVDIDRDGMTTYVITLLPPPTGSRIIILRAYLERTLVDVRSLLSLIEGSSYKISFDTPFRNSDTIKIYYCFEEE